MSKISHSQEINLSLKSLKQFIPTIRIGDTLNVQIKKVLSNKDIIINLKGREIIANTNLKLSKGDNLRVVLEQNKSNLVLKPAANTNDNQTTYQLIRLISRYPLEKMDIGKSLSVLFEQFSSFDTKIKTEEWMKFILDINSSLKNIENAEKNIKSIIKESGLFLENRLKSILPEGRSKLFGNDLKSALLSLLENLNNEQPGLTNSLKETLKKVIAQIESNQSINYLSKEQNGFQLIQIPFFMDNAINTARLYIKDLKKKKDSKQGFAVTIILDLTRINDIRIDILTKGSEISIRFHVKNEKIKSIFNIVINELETKLKAYGYSPTVECMVSNNNYIHENIIKTNLVFNQGLLDLKV